MNVRTNLFALMISASLMTSGGCQYVMSQMQPDSGSEREKKKKRLTKGDIKGAIADSREELPYRIDDDLLLTRIDMDFTGNINGWYQVSDSMTAKLRKIGSVKIEQRMREAVTNLDLEKSEVPEQLRQILEQEEYAIQYIFEDRYGLPIASVVVSKETMDGEQRVGRAHENPFAVRNVSLEDDAEKRDP